MHASSIISFLAIAAGIAYAAPQNIITGEGNPVFGNAGKACTVGGKEGECDQGGRCAKFEPPNYNIVLGNDVAECVAGGQVGVIDENGDADFF